MFYLVYRITNKLNGKSYTGCHKTKDKDDGYMGSGKYLKRAQKKDGLENFSKDVLFEASSSEEMFAKEKELVVLGPASYNLKLGGSGGFDFVNENYSKENRKNFGRIRGVFGGRTAGRESVILKRGVFDPKYAEKVKACLRPDAFFGKHHTTEAKAKIGAANSIRQSGIKHNYYGTKWITNPVTKENTRIFKSDIIPEGWSKGRKFYK